MQTKAILAIGLTLLTAATVYLNTDNSTNVREQFQQWQNLHGKMYGQTEAEYRFQIFAQNLAQVLAHNALYEAGKESIELEMNGFADLTNEEFSRRYLTAKASYSDIAQSHQMTISAPDSVDHRKTGRVSPVKNQGSCGSCWAFAAVGSLEGQFRTKYRDLELSEQELVDCATGEGYEESNGCQGGEMRDALRYSVANKIAIRSEYPYEAVDGACRRDKTTTRYAVSSWVQVPRLNESAFIEAAAQQPLSVSINAGGIFFQLYKKGIYNKACDGSFEALNHSVTLVGYEAEYLNLKNSWGTTWGEEGYIRFARISSPEGQCGVKQDVMYPII